MPIIYCKLIEQHITVEEEVDECIDWDEED